MTRKRTCTARCWNAKGTKCRCVCGGAKHGNARVVLNLEQLKEGEKAYEEAIAPAWKAYKGQKKLALEVSSE